MPNANAAQGLVPRMHRNGEPYSGSNRVYAVPASEANALFIGDPVVVNGDADPATGIPYVIRATAGATNNISGVMTGVSVRSLTSQSLVPYRIPSVLNYIEVCDNPDVVFEIQSNGSVVSGDMSANANLVAAAGNTFSGLSGWMLDESSVGAGATLQLKILRVVQRPDNALASTGGAYTKLEVMINLHTQRLVAGV